jgi:cell division protein FtsL
MKYKEMIAVSVEALKEQDLKISELESRYEKVIERAKEKGLL